MCGIVGFLSNHSLDPSPIDEMVVTLKHRGPDDLGVWTGENVSLGHTRLSIVDLSFAGHQPMVSQDGRFVITYNGEIYNAKSIDLGGAPLKGHSDTEVVLESCARFGVVETCQRLNGMFAFALFDQQKRLLYLARDRIGIKPLFFRRTNDDFIFASEIKALKKYPNFNTSIDLSSVKGYLRYGYVPGYQTIYSNLYQLKPAHVMVVDQYMNIQEIRYWSLQKNLTIKEPLEALEEFLSDAVSSHMVSDVSLGAFLSGGIDSSTIVSLMQKKNSIKTFCIGFEEQNFNEIPHARAIARHLGTDHFDLHVTPQMVVDLIPSLPQMFDEPFSDASQIPTYFVSKLAKEHVSVVLSGDGGDEILGGYDRYFHALKVFTCVSWIENPLTRTLSRMLPQYNKWNKLKEFINASSFWDKYRLFVTLCQNLDALMPDIKESRFDLDIPKNVSLFESMQYADIMTYLPHDILTKVDRTSMKVSLETRVPFLDHRVVEFCWNLPFDQKVQNQQSKWLLKKLLSKYVPPKMFDRPKQGFAIPLALWIRTHLKEFISDTLQSNQNFFDKRVIQQMYNEHMNQTRDHAYTLWTLAMFMSWYRSSPHLS